MSCPKCSGLATQTYRDGIRGYYLKGKNRELAQTQTVMGQIWIDNKFEHFEYYCTNCGYGWVEKIKSMVDLAKDLTNGKGIEA